MACNLKLLDYIRSQNSGKVIPGNGYWSWGGGSADKCGPFSAGQGTDPGTLSGDNPCIDVSGWEQMYYQFIYDTGQTFHYLVVNVKARPNAGCDTRVEICENDMTVDLKALLGCSPDDGGTWYVLNQDGINGTIDLINGQYSPANGDGGSTLRMMYGFGGAQEGICCGDTCQSAAVLEIKVNACDCNDLHVILRRDKNELIADYSGCGNTLTPEYRWYKDQVLIEGETGDRINFIGYGDGDFLVKVICGDCEEQDRFFSGETCAYPEIIGTEIDDSSEPYGVTVDVRHMDAADTIVVMHRTNVTESGYDEEEIETWDLTVNDLTFDVTPEYGKNELVITLTNDCGTISETIEFFKDCPELDPGLTAMHTICQGCWGDINAIEFLDGTPDAGGEWEDVLLSGQLDNGVIHANQLNVGLWEFRYTVNQDYASCTQSASLFIEVIEKLEAGQSTAINLCHDAGETDLLSLIPGNPDAGGEWYTDDTIDGTIDLVNGKITPAATDIGKTITIAYSHDPQTAPLPSGVTPAEYWLEFDGVDDYVQARDLGDLEYQPNASIELEIEGTGNQYIMGNSSYLGVGSNRMSSWYFRLYNNTLGVSTWSNTGSGATTASTSTFPTSQKIRLEYESNGSDLSLELDGVEVDNVPHVEIPSASSPNKFRLGIAPAGDQSLRFHGKIYSFQIGTETFPMNEGTGTTITGSEGTVLDIYGATWNSEGVEECNCLSYSLLTITIVDCTPPIPCPDDSGLGIDIAESTNPSPADAQWEDMLTITKTGTYEDAGVVATDDLYFSYDDGATWIQGDEVKDDDYYVKLTSAFQTTCSGGAQTGSHRMYNIALSNGENVQEGQLRSRLNNFSANYTDIESTDILSAAGASSSLIAERYFRWDVRHILNSGWELTLTHTHFDRGTAGGSCPSGTGSFGIHFYSGHRSGKRRILVERRITYNNGCDSIAIPASFEPTLPTCPEVPSNVGFTIVDPYKIGNDEYAGSVSCKNSVPGSTSDTLYVFEQPTGANGYASNTYACSGGSRTLSFNYSYVFQRIIQFADCPPIILQHNYNSPTSCPTASISCEKDDANGRARATRSGNPFNLSSDYLQRKVGSGSWVNYTEGTWVNVSSSQTVSFRRVANFNNGCPQQQTQCSVTVTPPNWSLSISCVGGNTIAYSASNLPPGGVFLLFRNGVVTPATWSGNSTPVSQNGNYQVKYKYNQVYYINSNVVNCGTSGGGCTPPTVTFGAPYVENGDHIKVPFTTTEIDDINLLQGSINPSPPGLMTFNKYTETGTLEVIGATPGQLYQFGVIATNQCGNDSDSTSFQMGCTSLQIDNVVCNFNTGKTAYDILVSPDNGTIPTSNGTYLSKPSAGRYRFEINQTSGTITGSHPLECTSISQSINCQCAEPVVNLTINCDNNNVFVSFTVTNENSVNGDYYLKIDGSNYFFTNTGDGSYSATFPKTGLSHSYDFYYTACGSTPHQTGTISCSCVHPSIVASATCDGTEVSYSFTVTNESQATSNYTILLNGSAVETKTRTGAGTYNGTLAVPAGSNNTVQVRVNSVCGGQRNSNIASANCACPAAALSISNVSCNSETQQLTFDVNQTNITGLQIKVNGGTITPGSNPQTAQGITGQNTILVTGTDSCAGTGLQDSVTFGCDCDQPGIALTASCNTSGLISFVFTVTDESRVSGNYRLIANGSNVKTITKASSGTYNSTWQGVAGTNYTLRIEAENECGGTTLSNTVGTNCACPASSLAIANLTCNASTQMLTFNLNRSNVSNLVLKVNGNTISPIPSNPISIQGQIGSNMIVATANDSCNGNPLSASQNINCLCNNDPTVSIGTVSESSGTITVPFTTTNISGAGQITFVANGVTRSVSGSGNSWSASFPAVSGNNSFSVQVVNSCGDDSDSDTYNYAPCVPPTITKIGQGTLLGGDFYVDFAVTNCDSITAAGATNFVSCQQTRAIWSPGSSVLNWEIEVSNDCGDDSISGTFDPCQNCNPTITEQGCEGGTYMVDFLFLIDESGSVDNEDEWPDMKATFDATVNGINSAGVNARYAVVQYNDSAFLQVPFTSNIATAKNWTRHFPDEGSDYLNLVLGAVRGMIGSSLLTRVGAVKHIIIMTDAIDIGDSRVTPYTNRNLLVGDGWLITVVKYKIPIEGTQFIPKLAANATVGPGYNGSVDSNGGDPQGSGTKPRRLHVRESYDGEAVPFLVGDLTTPECRLLAASGCGGGSIYSWAASGGGQILTGQGTNTITTNGVGSYTVTIDTGNGCQVQKTYNY